jgi:hypothetical protein
MQTSENYGICLLGTAVRLLSVRHANRTELPPWTLGLPTSGPRRQVNVPLEVYVVLAFFNRNMTYSSLAHVLHSVFDY